MRTSPVTCIPVVALVLAVGWGLPANTVVHAQTPGPDAGDPPARVGRMARLLGIVSFHTVDQTNWVPATLNYPVTSGNAFWTEPSSAAEIDVGAAHLALDQSTEFNVDVLDDRTLQATQTQGALFLRLRSVPNGDSYRITTPRGVAVITQPGAYEVVAGDANHPTMVTVLEGAARIDSTNASLSLGPRQTGRIDGSATFAVSVGPVIRDPFLMARLAQEQQAARPAASRNLPPPIVAQMTGGYALNNVGDWSPSPRYGHIWYPPVQATWVPYRDGHWGYVAPWGWTWIDDAPWGFAPFHYGRWVHEGSRWGWIPVEQGLSERARAAPVYAPALVSFLGFGVAVTVGTDRGRDPGGRDPRERDLGERDLGERALGERGGRNSVGWIPLGPREAYVPPYRASDRYVRAVNTYSVVTTTNITNVTNTTTVNNFVNRGAATVVPMTAMTASQPIAAKVEPVNPQLLAASVPRRAAPVQPTAATMGVTPVVARQLNLPPAAAVVAGPAAPGPALAPPPAVTPVAVTPVAARPNEGAPRPNGQSDVRPAGKGSPRPVMAPESAAPLPLAAALPILRPPTPAAPAHPESGGTAAGSNAAPAIVPPAIVPPAIVPPAIVPPAIVPPAIVPNIPPPARTAVTPPGPTLVGPAPVGNPPAVVSAPAPLKIVTPVPNPIPAATVPSAAPAPGPVRIVTPAPGQTSDAPPAAHSGGPGASPARPAEPHPAGAAGIAPAPLPAPMIVPAVPARSTAPALVPPPVAAPPAAAVAPKPPPPEAQHVPAPPPVVAAPVQAKVAEPAPKPPPPPPPAAQGVAPIAPPVAAALHGPAPSPASPPHPVAPPEIMAPVPVPPAAQLTPPPQGALPAQAHPGKPENDRAKSPEKP